MDLTHIVKDLVTKKNCLIIANPDKELGFDKDCKLLTEESGNCTNRGRLVAKHNKTRSDNTLYVVYKFGDNGPLIAKSFNLKNNFPVSITYDQKLQQEVINRDALLERRFTYTNSVIGVFANGVDKTKKAMAMIFKNLSKGPQEMIIIDKKALDLNKHVTLVTILNNSGRDKLLVKSCNENSDINLQNYMSGNSEAEMKNSSAAGYIEPLVSPNNVKSNDS